MQARSINVSVLAPFRQGSFRPAQNHHSRAPPASQTPRRGQPAARHLCEASRPRRRRLAPGHLFYCQGRNWLPLRALGARRLAQPNGLSYVPPGRRRVACQHPKLPDSAGPLTHSPCHGGQQATKRAHFGHSAPVLRRAVPLRHHGMAKPHVAGDAKGSCNSLQSKRKHPLRGLVLRPKPTNNAIVIHPGEKRKQLISSGNGRISGRRTPSLRAGQPNCRGPSQAVAARLTGPATTLHLTVGEGVDLST